MNYGRVRNLITAWILLSTANGCKRVTDPICHPVYPLDGKISLPYVKPPLSLLPLTLLLSSSPLSSLLPSPSYRSHSQWFYIGVDVSGTGTEPATAL